MSNMNRWMKFGLVIGGYMAACLLASGAVYINSLFTSPAEASASAGMSAFGDAILFTGVCGLCALFPTGLTVYFLLSRPKPDN